MPSRPFQAGLTASILFSFLLSLVLLGHCPSQASAQAVPRTRTNVFAASDLPWRPSENRTLVSPNGFFAAGFRPTDSRNGSYDFSVWVSVASDKAVVWSLTIGGKAPPIGSSSAVTLSAGVLSLSDTSSNQTTPIPGAKNGVQLELKDSGELVFGQWSSFSSPTNTVLVNQSITELRSGSYALLDSATLTFNGTGGVDRYWSLQDSNPPSKFRDITALGMIETEKGDNKVAADLGQNPRVRRLVLEPDGNLKLYSLSNDTPGIWVPVWKAVTEVCTIHGTCGPNAVCVSDSSDNTSCYCPPGFRAIGNDPRNGCERKIKNYLPKSKFIGLDLVGFVGIGKEDNRSTKLGQTDFEDCRARCLANNSCAAFAYKLDGTRNCELKPEPLLNGYWSPGPITQGTTYIRVAEAEEDDIQNSPLFTGLTNVLETVCPVNISLPLPPRDSRRDAINIAIVAAIFTLELVVGFFSFWTFLRRYSRYRDMALTLGLDLLPAGGPKRFSYADLKAATDGFSKVLGRGGFGVVYKGELPDHRAVAVKRLKDSQGAASADADFWAEVTIIARMHHLNLVRMWGFCAEKRQRLLVYEYVPNGSLDKHLFPGPNGQDRPPLDWGVRYRIAVGVARAVAYLHEECLEWVLHCDIKPENILLTDDFCPKVSDFGLAKLTATKEEQQVKFSRVRGTRGYMAPECARGSGPVTAKADVYSFGMVLLDLVGGVRANEFRRESRMSEDCYLPTWAYEKVFEEGRVEELLKLDPRAGTPDEYDEHAGMVERMVKTAMWCLQDRPEARPSMGKVAKMLEGTVEITQPEKPTL